MITLTQYVNYRLGSTPQEQARNFLGKPFGAQSLAEFWQYWNPVWGYHLLFYCYRTLRRVLTHAPATVATFFVCGLAHDLPFVILSYVTVQRFPLFTMTFFLTMNGLLVVLTEALKLRLTRLPTVLRWLVHILVLITMYLFALKVTSTPGAFVSQ
jgi:hypothetical protein